MKNFFKTKTAFTLAETMIVLVILGIVAAITIPALVRRHVESSNRTRIRKAMAVYDTAINKMVVENGIKSNDALINEFNADHNNNSCAKSRAYFKTSQDGANDCTFRASDGVWWNISDINHPIVAFNEDDLTDEIASGDTNKAFKLVGYLDNNGSLRVGDLAVAESDNQEYLTKLYNFVKLEVGGNGGAAGGGKIPGVGDNGLYANGCDPADNITEVYYHPGMSRDTTHTIDCHGNELVVAGLCDDYTDITTCMSFTVYTYNENDSQTLAADCSDPIDITTCENLFVSVYDEFNEWTADGIACSSPDITTCSVCHGINEVDCASLGQ